MSLVPGQGELIAEKIIPDYNKFMPLILEVLDGPAQGRFFRLAPGKIIGRARGDILIDDINLSGSHAKIEFDNKNQFILTDLGSSNGIILNRQKVKKVALMPGVKFQLGRSIFLVKEVSAGEADQLAPLLNWNELMRDFLTKNPPPDNHELSVTCFDPLLELEFTQGLQAETKWPIGYGPRLVGGAVWDLELQDIRVPDIAFELIPEEGKAKLINLCGDQLLVNKESVDSVILQSGDEIQIGSNKIRVSFKKS